MKVVIYQQDNGVAAIMMAAPEAVELYGLDAIARKDVPPGKPYRIIDDSELPTDQAVRDAWTVDAADLTDGVGNDSNCWDCAPLDAESGALELARWQAASPAVPRAIVRIDPVRAAELRLPPPPDPLVERIHELETKLNAMSVTVGWQNLPLPVAEVRE